MFARRLLLIIAGVLVALAAFSPAWACPGHAFVRVAIDPLPAELEGMRIEFHETMGPQLVIDNPTARTVEVLDENGIPFVRIGPGGVEGNVAAAAWYTSYSPAAVLPAAVLRSTDPRWVRASLESSFGWFESRLDASKVALAPSIMEAGLATDLEAWAIPLRVDGSPVMLRGHFRYAPPPEGAYRVQLTSARELAPGIRVRLLPGNTPGLFVENASRQAVVVIGAEGEPFLRIRPDGVDANLRSPTWWASGRGSATIDKSQIDAKAEPRWRQVSSASRFGWVEPRARGGQSTRRWQVPIHVGDQIHQITGTVTWRADDQLASAQR